MISMVFSVFALLESVKEYQGTTYLKRNQNVLIHCSPSPKNSGPELVKISSTGIGDAQKCGRQGMAFTRQEGPAGLGMLA